MVQLDLTKEEESMLYDMLEYDYQEIRNEISNTENWEFKVGLKQKEELIKKVLDVLILNNPALISSL